MSYPEALNSPTSLFSHRLFEEDNRQAEQNYQLSLLSKPSISDKSLKKIINWFPQPIRPDLLGIFGSAELRLETFTPIINRELERGSLSEKKAAKFREAILEGKMTLLFEDMKAGATTSWVHENIALAVMLINPGGVIPEDDKALMIMAFKSANIFALPHFLKRMGPEIRYSLEKDQPALNKALDCMSVGAGVLANALPIASNLATPLLNLPRHGDFSWMLIRHNYQNLRDAYKNVVV